jgi:hypothetical protein
LNNFNENGKRPQNTPGIGLQDTKKTIKNLKFPVLSEKYTKITLLENKEG